LKTLAAANPIAFLYHTKILIMFVAGWKTGWEFYKAD
jgi:membrane glycosyltransferase